MKYLLLLKTLTKRFFVKFSLATRINSLMQTSSIFFLLFFLALALPVFMMMSFLNQAQKFFSMDKQIGLYEKIVTELKKDNDRLYSAPDFEKIFENVTINDLSHSLEHLAGCGVIDVIKTRRKELIPEAPFFITSEQKSPTGAKQIVYSLARPVEVSAEGFMQLLQDVEKDAKKASGDQFFLKINLEEKKIVDGYTTLSLQGSILKREKA
jgi:hypothetical protein